MTTARPRRLGALVAGALLGCVVFGVLPAAAATTADVPTTLEAWYQSSPLEELRDPLCATPAGCPPDPVANPSPYPEDTLHVGATSGRTDAVTYLAFETATLPDGATLTGGTAILPVASTDDGTVAPETAELRACLVASRFEPAAGAPRHEAPEPGCGVTATARYVDDGDGASHFEVDLAPFAPSWRVPGSVAGIALLPVDDTTGTWHVAFSGRDRQGEEVAPPISAQLTYEVTSEDEASADPFTSGSGSFGGSTGTSGGSGSSVLSGGFASAPTASTAPAPQSGEPRPEVADPEPAPVAADPPAMAPIAAPLQPTPYPYPVVWLLPIALVLGGMAIARSLTGDVEVLGDDDPRDLIGRLWLAFFPDRGMAR